MKYQKHFLLDSNEVIDYVKAKKLFSETSELVAEEIGDGNINYVFRVIEEKTKKSIVLKQSDVLLRSSGRPLDLGRSKIEASILEMEGKLAPSLVPKIFFYDEIMCVLAMEDISDFKNLRKELQAGKIFPNFLEEITDFLARTLFLTTDFVLGPSEKKAYVKEFVNPELCDISECLVFTEPYTDNRKRNIITQGNEDFVEKELYQDKALHREVMKLKESFMNYSQSLIHGDLHSGSIFVNLQGTKVIDPEFAFYGPMAYDIGNVIGNLYFPLERARIFMEENEQKKEFILWLENLIVEIPNRFEEKVKVLWQREVKDSLALDSSFQKEYLEKIRKQTQGYAATEMIRRVVGDAKVMELTSLENSENKLLLEQNLIRIAKKMIMNNAL